MADDAPSAIHDGRHGGAPDWADVRADILCPLCDYNLRGLTQARCPECGHVFDWQDLRDDRRLHPYLFEHHPQRNLKSWWLTTSGGLNPTRFWRTLRPEHPIYPRRLLLYWLISTLLLGLIGLTATVATGRKLMRHHQAERASPAPLWGYNPQGQLVQVPRHLAFPPPSELGFYPILWRYDVVPAAWELVAWLALWPWLTVAALMLFRISMRKAKVRTGHVMRAAIYFGDPGPWLGLALAVLLGFLIARFSPTGAKKSSWIPHCGGRAGGGINVSKSDGQPAITSISGLSGRRAFHE